MSRIDDIASGNVKRRGSAWAIELLAALVPSYLTFLQGPLNHIRPKPVIGHNDVNELKYFKVSDKALGSFISYILISDEQLSLFFEGLDHLHAASHTHMMQDGMMDCNPRCRCPV